MDHHCAQSTVWSLRIYQVALAGRYVLTDTQTHIYPHNFMQPFQNTSFFSTLLLSLFQMFPIFSVFNISNFILFILLFVCSFRPSYFEYDELKIQSYSEHDGWFSKSFSFPRSKNNQFLLHTFSFLDLLKSKRIY